MPISLLSLKFININNIHNVMCVLGSTLSVYIYSQTSLLDPRIVLGKTRRVFLSLFLFLIIVFLTCDYRISKGVLMSLVILIVFNYFDLVLG